MAESPTTDNIPNTTTLPPDRISEMISFITCQKDAFFKSQQRDEADLGTDEKTAIVRKLFETDLSLFLYRYGKYLNQDHLNCTLESLTGTNKDDIISQIEELKKKDRVKQSTVKNRRFNALQKMLQEDSNYFSNSEMQTRNPYQFEQMVGQYMNEEERKELQDSSYSQNYGNSNFSSFLFEQIRNGHLKCQYMVEEHINEQEEEEDEDEDDDDEDNETEPDKINVKEKISIEKRHQLEDEFLTLMKENFLNGKDKDYFDYSTVDDNEDYDMSAFSEQDAEDAYFDSD